MHNRYANYIIVVDKNETRFTFKIGDESPQIKLQTDFFCDKNLNLLSNNF